MHAPIPALTLTKEGRWFTASRAGALRRECLIALTAFLTVVDLFATQAILPSWRSTMA
jgi:hypothetical protein